MVGWASPILPGIGWRRAAVQTRKKRRKRKKVVDRLQERVKCTAEGGMRSTSGHHSSSPEGPSARARNLALAGASSQPSRGRRQTCHPGRGSGHAPRRSAVWIVPPPTVPSQARRVPSPPHASPHLWVDHLEPAPCDPVEVDPRYAAQAFLPHQCSLPHQVPYRPLVA